MTEATAAIGLVLSQSRCESRVVLEAGSAVWLYCQRLSSLKIGAKSRSNRTPQIHWYGRPIRAIPSETQSRTRLQGIAVRGRSRAAARCGHIRSGPFLSSCCLIGRCRRQSITCELLDPSARSATRRSNGRYLTMGAGPYHFNRAREKPFTTDLIELPASQRIMTIGTRPSRRVTLTEAPLPRRRRSTSNTPSRARSPRRCK